MRVRVIGDKSGLAEDIRERIAQLEEASKNNDGLNFQIAINYGSRDEMIRAMKKMAADQETGRLKPEDISEEILPLTIRAGCPRRNWMKPDLHRIWIRRRFPIRIF